MSTLPTPSHNEAVDENKPIEPWRLAIKNYPMVALFGCLEVTKTKNDH